MNSKLIATGLMVGGLASLSYAAPSPIDAHVLRGSNQVQCMATAMYHEARGEDVATQLAVGNLVLNRALILKRKEPPCSVIKRDGQFPWYSVHGMREKVPQKIVLLAKFLVESARQGVRYDNTNGAVFMNLRTVLPFKTHALQATAWFPNMTFYKEKKVGNSKAI